jgi:hypothetical protein
MSRLSEAERDRRIFSDEQSILALLTLAFDPSRPREETLKDPAWSAIGCYEPDIYWSEEEVVERMRDYATGALRLAYGALRTMELDGMDVPDFLQQWGQALAERIERATQP